MNTSWRDFFFSFGMMLAGVFLLFVFSLGISLKTNSNFRSFPLAGERFKGGDEQFENYASKHPTVPLQKNQIAFVASSTAKSILVLDEKTGTVLFSKNSEESRPLASLTKMMSAIIVLELPREWSQIIEITPLDASFNGDHHVEQGESFTATDLWNASLIGSSNKAIYALSRTGGVTPEGFIALMNKKAESLGLKSLKFNEPIGLDSKNVGSAEDIAKLLKTALSYAKIRNSLETSQYYVEPIGADKKRLIWSTDWLLTNWTPNNFKGIAGKTGYIPDSGYNFAGELTGDGGHKIIVVVLGAETNEARFNEARDLGEWVFDNFVWPDETEYSNLVES